MLDVGAAGGRRQDLLDAGTVGREDLLLETTDREDLTSQCHLAGHGCKRARSAKTRARPGKDVEPRSELMPRFEKRLTKAVRMAIPADGPSLPMEPSLHVEKLSVGSPKR